MRRPISALLLIAATSCVFADEESLPYRSDMFLFVSGRDSSAVVVAFDFSRRGMPLAFVDCRYAGVLSNDGEWKPFLLQSWKSLGEPDDMPRSTSIEVRRQQGSRFIITYNGRNGNVSIVSDTLRPRFEHDFTSVAADGKGKRTLSVALARATATVNGKKHYGALLHESLSFFTRERDRRDTTYAFWEHDSGHQCALFVDDHRDMYFIYPPSGRGELRMLVRGYYGWVETHKDVRPAGDFTFDVGGGDVRIETSRASEWTTKGDTSFSAVGAPEITYTIVHGAIRFADKTTRTVVGVVRRVSGQPVGFRAPREERRATPAVTPVAPADTSGR